MSNSFKEPVKVLFHLNGGFTKVILERTIGVGLADFGIEWEIPTEIIPMDLRMINSRFILQGDYDGKKPWTVLRFD